MQLLFQCGVCISFSTFCLQRKSIVTGAVEPTDEECEWQSDHDDEELAVSISTVRHILHLNRHDVLQFLHDISRFVTGVVYIREIYVLTAHIMTVYYFHPGRH